VSLLAVIPPEPPEWNQLPVSDQPTDSVDPGLHPPVDPAPSPAMGQNDGLIIVPVKRARLSARHPSILSALLPEILYL